MLMTSSGVILNLPVVGRLGVRGGGGGWGAVARTNGKSCIVSMLDI